MGTYLGGGRRRPDGTASHARGDGLGCAVCREPASNWIYDSFESDGRQVIEGFAVCTLHHLRHSSRASLGPSRIGG